MNSHDQFSTIESTQEYLTLLSGKIDEVLSAARLELSGCRFDRRRKRGEAWQLVLYTTTKLSSHIDASRKLVSDLDTLKKLLDGNRYFDLHNESSGDSQYEWR
jgi:hypothetical protein